MDSLLESKKILLMFCVWPSQNFFSPLPKKKKVVVRCCIMCCRVSGLVLWGKQGLCRSVCVCVCVCFQRPCFLLDMADCGRGHTVSAPSIKQSLMSSQTITELSRNCPYVVINDASHCCFIWILIFNLVCGGQGYFIHKPLMDVP